MKRETRVGIWVILISLVLQLTYALDYHITPMNFEPGTSQNLTVSVTSPGDTIAVTYPGSFTLLSGSPNGTGSVLFSLESPNSSVNGDIYTLNLSINGTYYSNLYAIAVPSVQIVDNKWELGHGDFNYPDCQYLPDNNVLVFPIIRVWGVGTDLLDEPAKNISFTCNYPKIRPRTVDSKYTSDYTDPNYFIASGLLEEWEGASMFRVFVLSQEVDYNIGDNYEVTCSDVTYEFNHHTVIAPIPPINISIVNSNPFIINTASTDRYVEYFIKNNASYEIRDLEFEWTLSGLVHREEKDVMYPNETVRYRVWANGNPTISLEIRQKPCWMFNSRSPTYYTTSMSGSYLINTNTTEIFSIEEKIYYKSTDFSSITTQLNNITDTMDDLLFLFKINTDQYHISISKLPPSQQNELNFTCYRLGLRSNGINDEPMVTFQTPAQSASDVIVKNDLFLTKNFTFSVDPAGFGLVSWEVPNLGICTEDIVTANYVCPTTYNYICLADKLPQEISPKQSEVPQTLGEKMLGIGSFISPSMPLIGFIIFICIILLLIYLYYYYEDEVSIRKWIQDRRQSKERDDYLRWQEKEREKRFKEGLF